MKRLMPSKLVFLLLLATALVITAPAALAAGEPSGDESKAGTPPLTIEAMMKGEAFVGSSPAEPVWSVDGKVLYFNWKKPGAEKAELYSVTASDPTPRVVRPEDMLKNPPFSSAQASGPRGMFYGRGGFGPEMQFDKSGKRALVVQNGDIFLVEIGSGKYRQLTSVEGWKSGVKFTADGKKAVFSMDENLYVISLEDGQIRQMTSFTRNAPPERKAPDAIDKWYEAQQKDLFKELKGQMRFPGETGGAGLPLKALPKGRPFPLKEPQRVMFMELSPDEKYVFFMLSSANEEGKRTVVPNYVTRSGYTEDIPSYAKAAYAFSFGKAGIMSVETGQVIWADYGQGDRKLSPGAAIWSPDGRSCMVTAEAVDRKDSWLRLLDPATGKTAPVFQVHDEAWVGQYGLTDLFFWPDGKSVCFISEKDGYAALYKVSLDGKELTPLAKGSFEVQQAWLSKDGKRIYLVTNEPHPGETELYSMPAAGGQRTQITALVGLNEITMSPDESRLAVIHSETNVPGELYIQPNKPGAAAQKITLSTTEQFRSYNWMAPEVLSFKARDGVDVYARLYKPEKQHPSKPAVIFIHGAGYLQAAHKGWSYYYHEFMFNNFLAQHGYYVMEIDYRGSAGYGRDCRTGIYRHMGGKDLDDLVDGVRWLTKNYPVDPGRIGCYGGSYGGFLTLMALFTASDTFQAGAALRPVTDWAHYHPGYTVDILNLPQDDPEAYKKSSPIYFAEGLKGALLICHGVVDTNVHFQDTVRLAQRLIELGKDNWSVAFYPVEDHSFTTASAWTDEYKRIFKLFETNLK